MDEWTREIVSYKYRLRKSEKSTNTHRYLLLLDKTGKPIGNVRFTNSRSHYIMNAPAFPTDQFVNLFLETSAFPELIDMLRNEKPVYLRWGYFGSENLRFAEITTSEEPIGEEEAVELAEQEETE